MNKPEKIVLASGNKKKVAELQALLESFSIQVSPQSEFKVEDAEETGLTFVENAIIKARNACEVTGLPALADDSGIEVDALKGAPGIYSARFAGEPSNDANNNALLLEKLAGIPVEQRTARFQCVLVYMEHAADPTPIICQGSWEGEILENPRGEAGFGYDPLFYVDAQQCTAAQLPAEQKSLLSHRGQAMAKLKAEFNKLYQ